jgi:hypothetical protein
MIESSAEWAYQQGLVRRLVGGDWIVYSVPKG